MSQLKTRVGTWVLHVPTAASSPKKLGAGWHTCAATLLGFAAETYPASP